MHVVEITWQKPAIGQELAVQRINNIYEIVSSWLKSNKLELKVFNLNVSFKLQKLWNVISHVSLHIKQGKHFTSNISSCKHNDNLHVISQCTCYHMMFICCGIWSALDRISTTFASNLQRTSCVYSEPALLPERITPQQSISHEEVFVKSKDA